MLFTCIKSWFFRNHLANFHLISHWSFCWNVIDSLFKLSCFIDCQAHIFFFKTKNCSNDDIFISCNNEIGKMLHNICMSVVAMSLRRVNRGPWASCFTFELSYCLDVNTIKVYNSGYLVCTTPPTVLYQSIWNFAGPFVMVCRWGSPCGATPLFWLRHLTIDSSYLVHQTPHTVLYLLIWNFADTFVMVCRLGSPCRVTPLFWLSFLVIDSGYLVCPTPHTVLYWLIWNFAGTFVMVCRCAYGFSIIFNSIFSSLFWLLNSHFLGLNTILVHYCEYLVCANPPTVLYWSVWNFAGPFVMVCRHACAFGIIIDFIFVTFFDFWT